jgi:hypothetical protein
MKHHNNIWLIWFEHNEVSEKTALYITRINNENATNMLVIANICYA